MLVVNRPEIAEEFFLTKNKYFDKPIDMSNLFKKLLGDSILV